jgi:hypothetical protein
MLFYLAHKLINCSSQHSKTNALCVCRPILLDISNSLPLLSLLVVHREETVKITILRSFTRDLYGYTVVTLVKLGIWIWYCLGQCHCPGSFIHMNFSGVFYMGLVIQVKFGTSCFKKIFCLNWDFSRKKTRDFCLLIQAKCRAPFLGLVLNKLFFSLSCHVYTSDSLLAIVTLD